MGALHYGKRGKQLHSTALTEDLRYHDATAVITLQEQLQFSISAVSGHVRICISRVAHPLGALMHEYQ
jgi:hypothetical protein